MVSRLLLTIWFSNTKKKKITPFRLVFIITRNHAMRDETVDEFPNPVDDFALFDDYTSVA